MRTLLCTAALLVCLGCPEGKDVPEASDLIIDAGALKPALATLVEIKGSATLTRAGMTAPAAEGPLEAGDVIETGAGGDGLIRFAGGHEVQIGSDGRFEIISGDDGLVLSVGQGLVVSRVVGDLQVIAGGGLSILTPYGLVRVGSSSVKIGVSKDDATIDVLAGNVSILSRNGGAAMNISAGQLSVLNREGLKAGTREVQLGPMQFVLEAITGRVELKKQDAKAFGPLNPKKAIPGVEAGDLLRTGAGSATFAARDSRAKIVVGSNSEVGIGEVPAGSGLEEAALDLRKGAMVINMPIGIKRKLRTADGYSLTANDGAQFSVARSKTGLDLNMIVGELVVEHDGMQSVTVRGAQSAKLATTGATTSIDLAKETLTLPSRSYRLYHPNVGNAALTWEGESGTAFHVIVGNEPTLAKPVIDGIIKQPWLNVNVPARGGLYWRVLIGEKQIARGAVQAAPERATGELGRLRNEVPEGAEKTVIYYQDKPPSVTFLWKPPADITPVPAEYRLQVYNERDLTKPIEERMSKTTTLQLPENALGEGNYAWSVTPLDAKGQALAGGRMTKLEMVYDNAVSELVIKAPRNGDAGGASVPVIGIAPFKTRVSANGQLLPLDDKARFNSKVAPVGKRVVFRTAGEGGEQFIVRQLRRGK